MSRIARIFGYVGLVVLALVVVFGISLVLSNLSDDQLNPEVERILSETHRPISPAVNGYFTHIGVLGPEDMEPHEWGVYWHETATKAATVGGNGSDIILTQEKQTFSLAEDAPCRHVEDCLTAVIDHPDDARRVLDDSQHLLKRCDRTLDYSQYQEPWQPELGLTVTFPIYPTACRDLQSMYFAFTVASNQDDMALSYLDRVMAFHKLQLRGSYSLLSKVVAISYLMRDYRLLNQYLLLRPIESRQGSQVISRMLSPINVQGRSMERVLKSEFAFAAHGFLDLQSWVGALETGDTGMGKEQGLMDELFTRLTFLPKATVNEYYRKFSPYLNLERASGQNYREMAMALERDQASAQNSGLDTIYSLRNPVGHILIQIGGSNLLPYIRVRDDMLALRALVAFQFNLIERGVTDLPAIEKAVSQEQLIHRYTGEFPTWNRKERTLSYTTASKPDHDPLAIKL